MTTDPLGGARETLEARLKAAEKHAEAIWNALSRDEQIRLYHHEGLGLDPIIGPLREAADALRATGAEVRCDCGATLTLCASCAVADYQAAHSECRTCCPPSSAGAGTQEPPA